MDVYKYGVWVDKKKDRVQCNYCGKEMSGWYRLKCHLGSVGNDVTHCDEVALAVRETFRNMVIKKKPSLAAGTKRVREVQMGNSHNKRGRREEDSSTKCVSLEKGNRDVVGKNKGLSSNKAQKCIPRSFYENDEKSGVVAASKRVGEVQMGKSHDKRGRREEDSSTKRVSLEKGNRYVEAKKQELLSNKAHKGTARFFYENDNKPDVAAASKRVPGVQMGKSHDKRGRREEDSSTKRVSLEKGNRYVEAKKQELLSNKAHKGTARFFYENDNKPDVAAASKRVGQVQIDNSHNECGRREEDSSTKCVSPEKGNRDVDAKKQELLSNKAHKGTARFFYKNDNKPDVAAASKRVPGVQVSNSHNQSGRREEDSSNKRVEKGNRDVEAKNQDLSSNKAQKCTARFFYENDEKPGLSAASRRVLGVQMSNSHNKHGSREEDSSTKRVSPEKGNTDVVAKNQELLSNKAQKCIALFFYENDLDISAVGSPSFREMMTVGGGQMPLKIPDSHGLNGWMLQETLKEVQDHVKKIKDSWSITGCSILLDAWIDQKGRDLVTFVADCPAGSVYLKSFDVSDIKSNSNALISLVEGLLDEVGMPNVIQIIAGSTSGWVGELGKSFPSNNRKVFWSVSISHCFELMLVQIGKMASFGDIFDKVNKIREFIKKHPSVMKLLRDHSQGTDMTVSSFEFEFVTPYLTLESTFKAKKGLAAMFASSDWNKEEDITISKLVNDSSFWETVERVMKCTSPLIRGLLLFSTANNQHVGYIYDTMDGIKESIAKEFNNVELFYKALWDVIDDVWNNHLHSPLHSAGYILNPTSFYSTDFHLDPEVATGFASSLVHMVKERDIQVKIATQLDMYRLGKNCFNEASQADQISGIAPAEWWAQKASKFPEVQSFAIKILSQTCEGASRYKLKRRLAEKLLLTKGMSYCEKQRLEQLAFVHYNLHLQSCKARLSEEQ